MTKIYTALAAIGGALVAVLYAFSKGAESAKNKAEALASKAEAKSLERQAKAAQKRQAKARKRIHEAEITRNNADDINRLFDEPDDSSDH